MGICRKDKLLKRLSINLLGVYGKLARDLPLSPRDKVYLLRRVKSEGVTFVTTILPQYSKALLKAIEDGMEFGNKPLSWPTSFEFGSYAPRFMHGLYVSALDGNPSALWSIRQICEYGYKLVLTPSSDEAALAFDKYVELDKSLDVTELSEEWTDLLRKVSHSIFPKTMSAEIHQILGSSRPRHGSGSFSELPVLDTSRVGIPRYWKYKPDSESLGTCPSDFDDLKGFFRPRPASKTKIYEAEPNYIARFACVPKDARGPRNISLEPFHLIRAQMGVHYWLRDLLHKESKGRINFVDQSINRAIAKSSSVTREYATLDLKEASDRVTTRLVRRVVRHAPGLKYATEKFRSRFITYTDKRTIPYKKHVHEMRKFANMGSGLCFPVLAMMVYISAVASIHLYARVPIRIAAKNVYVYGDDLIVPVEYVGHVKTGLENSGLRLNADKSYSRSYFRESCGGDYYHGDPVMPVRLRLSNAQLMTIKQVNEAGGTFRKCRSSTLIPRNSDGVRSALLQVERHCRELVENGLFNTAEYFYRIIEYVVGEPLQDVSDQSPYLGRVGLCQKGIRSEFAMQITNRIVHFDDLDGEKGIADSLRSTSLVSQLPFGDLVAPKTVYRRPKTTEAQRLAYGLA